jgi:flagellin
MRIGTTTPSYSSYYQSIDKQQKAMLRIATSQRINSAADDAAALAISEGMRGQISGLNQAASNTQNSVSLLNTAEGAMNNSTDVVQRMRQLDIQASNGIYTDGDRAAMQAEMNQLSAQLDTNANNTEFNTLKTNNGSLNNFITQVGANSGQNVSLSIANTSYTALGINNDVSTQSAASSNLQSIDGGLESLTSSRAQVGAITNRLTSSGENATQSAINLQSAESTIRDSDIARQTSLFQQSNVGMYAAMMSLAKSMNAQQSTLSLLA